MTSQVRATLSILATLSVVIFALSFANASGETKAWQPADVSATGATLEDATAILHASNPGAGLPQTGRSDEYQIVAKRTRLYAKGFVRDNSYSITASLGGHVLHVGRTRGVRWRANSAGTVHLIRADIQGDEFDRWPVAVLGFALSDCTLLGEANIPQPVWVLADRPARDIPRFLFIEKTTGDIVREVSREGSRVIVYDFDDFRAASGTRRPFHWISRHDDLDEDVTLVESHSTNVSDSDVAIPGQGPPIFPALSEPLQLDTEFDGNYVGISLSIDGVQRHFVLDSGTTQTILDAKSSRDVGVPILGHLNATIKIGENTAPDVPMIEVPFFFEGLLGYDFFRGRIVHIDYLHKRVDVLPREKFVAPADAGVIATDWSEGLPIVVATVGTFQGERFALDSGSSQLFLTRDFSDRAATAATMQENSNAPFMYGFLEGRIEARELTAANFSVGSITLKNVKAVVEVTNAENLSVPLDGIIGIKTLNHSEWWFDADGDQTWYR